MKIDSLHKWLIIRLAILWLILSCVIGGMINYFGNRRLNGQIVAMAKSETGNYQAFFSEYLKTPNKDSLVIFEKKIRSTIESDHLIVVEFYDAEIKKILEVTKLHAERIEKALNKHDNSFSMKNEIVTEKLRLGSEVYLRVFVPIFDDSGAKLGYLEGIYNAPGEIIREIRRDTIWSLVMVVAVLFMTALALYPLIIRMNRKLIDYSKTLALTNIGILKSLGSAVAKRDSDTNAHNYRVTLYSIRIGEKIGIQLQAMQGLIKGAFLHDVGKIGVRDSILLKPGKLTYEEFEEMKSHVRHGEDIIGSYEWLSDAVEIVLGHHEKFDGSGYPSGVSGDNIPLNARIFAVADVFDALTSRRPYKEPFSFDESVRIISESKGSHFDPSVAGIFLKNASEFYNEICSDDEVILQKKLSSCISKYFQ